MNHTSNVNESSNPQYLCCCIKNIQQDEQEIINRVWTKPMLSRTMKHKIWHINTKRDTKLFKKVTLRQYDDKKDVGLNQW